MTTPHERLAELQGYIGQLLDATREIDSAFLATCTEQERALQAEVRYRLHEYFDQIWSEPERATEGKEHASNHPAYPGVGALRDLTVGLWVNAQEAQGTAGDDVDSIAVETTVSKLE